LFRKTVVNPFRKSIFSRRRLQAEPPHGGDKFREAVLRRRRRILLPQAFGGAYEREHRKAFVERSE
jgi:hypothetical protein